MGGVSFIGRGGKGEGREERLSRSREGSASMRLVLVILPPSVKSDRSEVKVLRAIEGRNGGLGPTYFSDEGLKNLYHSGIP